MEYINAIELQGTVGNVRNNTISGSRVQSFSMVTQCAYRKQSGDLVCETTWHQVSAWNKAEVHYGDWVNVKGRLKHTKYTTADGQEKSFNEVIASEVTIINEATYQKQNDLPE